MNVLQAGQAMYAALQVAACTCKLKSHAWPFMKETDKEHVCSRCLALAAWDEAQKGILRVQVSTE